MNVLLNTIGLGETDRKVGGWIAGRLSGFKTFEYSDFFDDADSAHSLLHQKIMVVIGCLSNRRSCRHRISLFERSSSDAGRQTQVYHALLFGALAARLIICVGGAGSIRLGGNLTGAVSFQLDPGPNRSEAAL